MSALSLAVLLKQAGLEPVLQYHCRDRYLLGMQSDLLGAHATGIRNVLLVTGDPRKRGDYSDATLVFDVDSIGLANAVTRLNRGRDVGGQAIGRRHGVPRRRGRQPHGAAPGRRGAAVRVQGRGRARSSRSPCRFSTSTRSTRSWRRRPTCACRSWPPCVRSTACCTPSSWPTKCRICASPRRCWPDARRRRRRGAPPRKGWPLPSRSPTRCAVVCRGCRWADHRRRWPPYWPGLPVRS